MKMIASVTLLLTLGGFPSVASAQATPDIADAINQGTRIAAAREAQDTTEYDPSLDSEATIDGEAGIYVLKVNEIFYLTGGVGGGWSENPLGTIDDEGSSAFANAAITAGLQTKIAGKLDFGASARISGVEFVEDFAPSSRTVNSSVFAGTPIKGTPLYFGVSAFGGRSFNGEFSDGTWFYGANSYLTAGRRIGPNTLVRGTASAGRNENQISENNNWNATLDFELTQIISPKFALGAQARIARTWFDDFFEDVTFASRSDWQYGGNINASWVPLDWLAVTGSVGYEKRDSGFFLSSYDGVDTAITVSTRKRF